MSKTQTELCGNCGAEIALSRRVDFTLKDGTRVCDSCFAKKAQDLRNPRGIGPIENTRSLQADVSEVQKRRDFSFASARRCRTSLRRAIGVRPFRCLNCTSAFFLLFRTSTTSVYRAARPHEHSFCRSPIWPRMTDRISIGSSTDGRRA